MRIIVTVIIVSVVSEVSSKSGRGHSSLVSEDANKP